MIKDRHVQLGFSVKEAQKKILDIRLNDKLNYGNVVVEMKKALNLQDSKIVTELIIAYDRAADDNLKLYPGAMDLLKFLVRNRIKIGIITNFFTYRQWKKLILLGLQDFFDIVKISEEENIAKPDARIFKAALRELDVDPSNAIFIGDRPDTDIEGANEAGMITIRLRQGDSSEILPLNEKQVADAELRSLKEIGKILVIQ